MTKSVLKDLESVVKECKDKPSPLFNDGNGEQIKLLEQIVASKKENKLIPDDCDHDHYYY